MPKKEKDNSLKIIRGIAQAAAMAYDGALDEDGKPLEIGLKREQGNPLIDKRIMDGFKVKVSGTKLIVSYHSELLLKDVYANKKGSLESELEQTMADIVKYLKKQYRKITKSALSLKEVGEVDAMVQTTSRIRVFVTASKIYEIQNLTDVEDAEVESTDTLEASFKKFLDQGGLGTKAKNDKRKTES